MFVFPSSGIWEILRQSCSRRNLTCLAKVVYMPGQSYIVTTKYSYAILLKSMYSGQNSLHLKYGQPVSRFMIF